MLGKLKRFGRYAGYGLFTLFLILYFAFLTFPYEVVQERYLREGIPGLPWKVTVERLEATPLLWIRASGIRVLSRAKDPRKPLLTLEDLRLRPAFLHLLVARPALRFKGDLCGGKLRGLVARKGTETDLSIRWKGIDLGQVPTGSAIQGGKLTGRLRGSLDLRLRQEARRFVPVRGNLEARLREGSAKGLRFHGFELPPLKGLKADCKIEVTPKKAAVDSLALEASDLSVGLTGEVDLSPRLLAGSLLKLKGRVKLGGNLAAQYQPILAGILRNRDDEGYYTFSVRGSPLRPQFNF